MNIILFGPPGAGKGTQAENLVRGFDFFKISTGDLLRAEANKQSSFGNKIKSIIDQGLFVSDNLINHLIKNILSGKQKCTRRIISESNFPIKKNSKKLIDVTYLNTLRLHFFIAQELLNINISSASASQLLSLSCLEKTKIDDVVRMYEDNILEWEELFKIPLSDKRWQEKKDEVNAIIDGKTYAEGSESNFVESFHECL